MKKGFSKTPITRVLAQAFEHDANSPAAQPWPTQPQQPWVSPYPGCSQPAAAKSQDHLQPLHPTAPRTTQANAHTVTG